MVDNLLQEDHSIFTPDLDLGILHMRNNLLRILPDLAEASEKDYVSEVIYEFCEEIKSQLLIYSVECTLLHEFDILYLRRRSLFKNDILFENLKFLHTEFYTSLPSNPLPHCLNLCLVDADETLVPHFYLKIPIPSKSVKLELSNLLAASRNQGGDIRYMIHETWFTRWKTDYSYVEPINNILNVDTVILNGVNCESPYYHSIPEWGWRCLIAWYGILGCKLAIQRGVIKDSYNPNDLVVEATPDDIWTFLFPNDIDFNVIRLLAGDSFDKVKSKIKRIYCIRPHVKVRLYSRPLDLNKFCSRKWELLGDNKSDSELLRQNGIVMLVVWDEECKWQDPNVIPK